jgi:hypothetical protein
VRERVPTHSSPPLPHHRPSLLESVIDVIAAAHEALKAELGDAFTQVCTLRTRPVCTRTLADHLGDVLHAVRRQRHHQVRACAVWHLLTVCLVGFVHVVLTHACSRWRAHTRARTRSHTLHRLITNTSARANEVGASLLMKFARLVGGDCGGGREREGVRECLCKCAYACEGAMCTYMCAHASLCPLCAQLGALAAEPNALPLARAALVFASQ